MVTTPCGRAAPTRSEPPAAISRVALSPGSRKGTRLAENPLDRARIRGEWGRSSCLDAETFAASLDVEATQVCSFAHLATKNLAPDVDASTLPVASRSARMNWSAQSSWSLEQERKVAVGNHAAPLRPCFGVLCTLHGRCARYAAVGDSGSDPKATMATCRRADSFPLFVAISGSGDETRRR